MSVLDQLKKLDEQRAQLLNGAKQEAMDAVNTGIKALKELGFHFHLTEGQGSHSLPRNTGKRRSGIRDEVFAAVKASGGITRAKLLKDMGASDKSAQQSISNALAALKKSGTITAENGVYKA